jgi:hypothetical protein
MFGACCLPDTLKLALGIVLGVENQEFRFDLNEESKLTSLTRFEAGTSP